METTYYVEFLENLKHKKIETSQENRSEIISILCRVMRLSKKEESDLLDRKPIYIFTNEYSIKWSNRRETFEDSLYKEITEEEILHTPLIKPYCYTDEILEAVKEHGVLVESIHGEEYLTILSIFDREVTMFYNDAFRKFLPYEMAMYYRFLDGTPFGIPVTLQEVLEL